MQRVLGLVVHQGVHHQRFQPGVPCAAGLRGPRVHLRCAEGKLPGVGQHRLPQRGLVARGGQLFHLRFHRVDDDPHHLHRVLQADRPGQLARRGAEHLGHRRPVPFRMPEPVKDRGDPALGHQAEPGPVLRRHVAVPGQPLVHGGDRRGAERPRGPLDPPHRLRVHLRPVRLNQGSPPSSNAYASASLTGRSSRYRSMAWAGNLASTAPLRASSHSTATVIDSASTWKKRLAAGRVSEKPNPSVPSEVYDPGTQRAIWSGTALIQSETATTGPGAPPSTEVRYGTCGGSSGCSMFHDSQPSASRRSSVQDVADHTSADTPQSVASISCAVRACRSATPEARIWARGTGTTDRSAESPPARPASQSRTAEAGAAPAPPAAPEPSAGEYRYRPCRMPSSRPAVPPGKSAGSAGCGYGSL